jgi:hypothetical protein
VTSHTSEVAPESPASAYFNVLRSLRPDKRLTEIIERVENEMAAGPENDRLAKYAKNHQSPF